MQLQLEYIYIIFYFLRKSNWTDLAIIVTLYEEYPIISIGIISQKTIIILSEICYLAASEHHLFPMAIIVSPTFTCYSVLFKSQAFIIFWLNSLIFLRTHLVCVLYHNNHSSYYEDFRLFLTSFVTSHVRYRLRRLNIIILRRMTQVKIDS